MHDQTTNRSEIYRHKPHTSQPNLPNLPNQPNLPHKTPFQKSLNELEMDLDHYFPSKEKIDEILRPSRVATDPTYRMFRRRKKKLTKILWLQKYIILSFCILLMGQCVFTILQFLINFGEEANP